MKSSNPKILFAIIKAISLFLVVGLVCLFTLALKTKKLADDVWKQLGISQTDGNIYIYNSVQNGSLQYYIKNAKNLVKGDRTAIVNQLVEYAQKYVESDEFKRRYENERKIRKPKEPELSRISADSIRMAERTRIENQIKQAEANANSPNEKLRNSVPYRIETLKKELKAVDDPNNKSVQAKINQAESMNTAVLNQYKKDLEKLETDLPVNPKVLLKRRLQQVLDITADVDYDAELKEVGKFKVFVNPVYEKKSKDWKLAYRAGRQTTELIRAWAKKWVGQLN